MYVNAQNLVIHDLSPGEWEMYREEFGDCYAVTDNGMMHPCIGCFSCWNRDPGRCAVRDGYENMGYLIHHSAEITVISRYTYGGFSGPVKNVFDRCFGYVLPQFEVIRGETHHKKRYDEDKAFTFIFYGDDLSEQEKESAGRYVHAVCANIRGHVKDVIFRDTGEHKPQAETASPSDRPEKESSGKVVLLNGSMRSVSGNSAKFARHLQKVLNNDSEIMDLKDHMGNMSELVDALKDSAAIVLCIPLYVDGLPSQVIRLMERFEAEYRGRPKKIYILANMGLYESSQLKNLFSAVKQWCDVMDFEYCGGLGISAGELLGTLSDVIPMRIGPNKRAAEGIDALADAIDKGRVITDIFAEPYRFPRSLYIFIANTNWNRTAKQNGLKPRDLYRKL